MRIILLLLFAIPVQAEVLTIASWNILCAVCETDPPLPEWQDRRDGIIDRISSGGADIVGLQEVTPGEPLNYIIENLTEYTPCYGPIKNDLIHVLFLVRNEHESECAEPIDLIEGRTCGHVIVDGIHYYNCHFPLGDRLNFESTKVFIEKAQEPFIFLGDFNTHLDQYPDSHELMSRYVQTKEPFNPSVFFYYWLDIDRIGTSQVNFRPELMRDPPSELSDHQYLEARFIEYTGFFPVLFNYIYNEEL